MKTSRSFFVFLSTAALAVVATALGGEPRPAVTPSITVTFPRGGEAFTPGSFIGVNWTSVGVSGTVDIGLSADGGGSWAVLRAATSNDGFEQVPFPSAPGTTYRVRVQKTGGGASDTSGNFIVANPPQITGPPSLPNAKVGQEYAGKQFTAQGLGTLSWRLTGGGIAPGMWLSRDGWLKGAPTAPGTYRFKVTVADKVAEDSREFTLVVEQAENHPPVLSSYSPETPFSLKAETNQVFEVWPHDEDGDPMTCSWKLDGVAVGNAGMSHTYRPGAGDVGAHTLAVIVTDNRGGSASHSWSVTVTCGGGSSPRLEVDTGKLTASCQQGSSPAGQAFRVRNSGTGTLAYAVASNAAWLSCSPASGDSTGEEDTIAVKFDASGLAAGTHHATINVTAAGAEASPQEVSVELTVTSSGNDGGGSGGGSSSKKSSKKDTKAGGGSGGGGGCCLAGGGSPLTDPAFLALPYALVLLMRRRRKRSGR